MCRYVHRVGRTARLGASGEAILMLMPSERDYVALLQQHGMKLEEHSLDRLMKSLKTSMEDEGLGHAAARSAATAALLITRFTTVPLWAALLIVHLSMCGLAY